MQDDNGTAQRTAYRTIVADPPWPYPGGFNGFGKRRSLPYPAMSVTEIASLRVGALLESEGYLFLWTTNKWLGEAFGLLAAWELSYRQIVTWCKPPVAGLGGMFGTNTEFVLIGQKIAVGTHAHGTRTNRKRIATSWFEWPRRSHSEKPEEFYDLVQQVSPPPYLDLFSRRPRLGWKAWGNEVPFDPALSLAVGCA